MAVKVLTPSLNPPVRSPQLIITLSLRDIIVRWRMPSSGFKKMFAESFVEIASLESKYEVVEDNTRSNEDDGPLVVLWRRDLDPEFV
jgi:hypothetical protein